MASFVENEPLFKLSKEYASSIFGAIKSIVRLAQKLFLHEAGCIYHTNCVQIFHSR